MASAFIRQILLKRMKLVFLLFDIIFLLVYPDLKLHINIKKPLYTKIIHKTFILRLRSYDDLTINTYLGLCQTSMMKILAKIVNFLVTGLSDITYRDISSKVTWWVKALWLKLEGSRFNPTRCSAGLKDPTSLRGSRWPFGSKVEIIKTQWLRSG